MPDRQGWYRFTWPEGDIRSTGGWEDVFVMQMTEPWDHLIFSAVDRFGLEDDYHVSSFPESCWSVIP